MIKNFYDNKLGKQQASVFQALMSNYGTYEKLRKQFSENEQLGSMDAENDKYVASISGKLNRLKETWISIGTTIVNSDFTKGLLDGAIGVSEAIDGIVQKLEKFGLLTPVITGLGVSFASMMKTMSNGGTSAPMMSGITGFFDKIKNGEKATTLIGNGFKTMGASILSAGKFLGGFLLQAGAIALVTTVVSAGVKAWDNYSNKLANNEKRIKGSMEELGTSLKGNRETLTYLQDTEKRYNELIAKKKEYSSIKAEDMTQEQVADMQELSEITNELAEKLPSLVIGYDEKGSPILNMANDMEGLKQKTEEQIKLQEKLMEGKRKELGDNSRKQYQDGEPFKKSLKDQYTALQDDQSKKLADVKRNESEINQARDNGNKIALSNLKKSRKDYLDALEESQNKQLEMRNTLIQKEKEAQVSSFDTIKNQQGFGKLDEKQSSQVSRFADNMNWLNLDTGKTTAWQNSFQKITELAGSGSPKIEQWNKSLENANKVYERNGDVKEYEKSITGLSKAISSETGLNQATVFDGLKGIDVKLNSADQAMQNFLVSFGKTRNDLLNGDDISQKLAKEFESINTIISNAEANGGDITYDMAVNIESNTDIPQQVRDLVGNLKKDGMTDQEDAITIEIMTILKEGKNGQTEAKIEALNKKLVAMGQKPIDIKTLFSVDGLEKAKQLDDALNKVRKSAEGGKIDTKVLVDVVGKEKADLYVQVMEKIRMSPEMTNKFILDNQDALSKMKTIEEVKKYIMENPDMINTYKIEGMGTVEEAKNKKKELEKPGEAKTNVKVDGKENLDDTKNKKKEVEKDGEAKTKVTTEGADEAKQKLDDINTKKKELDKPTNLTINKGELQGSVGEFSKLVEYSTKLKDGQYQISFKSDTANAIAQIDNLKLAVNNLSNQFMNMPTKTVQINTSKSAQNITGLINKINQIKGVAGGIKTIRFSTETALASKNVTGLINKIRQCMALKPKTIRFNSETAQASKNITGLINKIRSVPTGTKTIRYNVVTAYSTSGSPTPQSSGSKFGGSSIEVVNPVEQPVNQPSVAPQPVAPTPNMQVSSSATTSNNQASASASGGFGSSAITSTRRLTQSTPIASSGSNIDYSIEYDIDLLKELDNRVNIVSNSLSNLSKKMEDAVGKEKINYIKEQNKLLEEQSNVQDEIADKLYKQQSQLKKRLKESGVRFNNDDNFTNYEELLLDKEAHLRSLEKISSQEKASEGQKQRTEEYKKELDDLKKYQEAYTKITFSELPKIKEGWVENASAIRKNTEEIKKLQREYDNYNNTSKLKEIDLTKNSIDDLKDNISEQMKNDSLENNIKSQEKILSLLEKELKLEGEKLQKQKDSLGVFTKELSAYGVKFDLDGNIKNYSEILNKFKDSKDLEYLNSLLEDYFKIQKEVVPTASAWKKNRNEIIDTKKAIDDLKDSLKKLSEDSLYKDNNRDITVVKNAISKNEIELENATGQRKVELLEQQIKLNAQLKKETQDLMNFENERRKGLVQDLTKYGFAFREDGSIPGYGGKIAKLKETLSDDEFKKVFAMVEEYIETTNKTIPGLSDEIGKLNNQIKNAYKEQLKTTKDTQDKISQMYKQQVDDRKKLIDDELKYKQDALKKEQDAYNDSIKEQDYKNEKEDQLKVISDLQKKIDSVSRDDTASGQKQLKELMDKMKEEQKKLEDLVKDKINDDVNNMFDKESDRLGDLADKSKEELDKKYSDENIQDIINKTLSTGLFTDLDGNVKSLQEAMIDYINKYEDGLLATGALVKTEWIDNLTIAQETMQNMSDIMNTLDFSKFSNLYSTERLSGNYEQKSSTVVQFNSPLLNVQGNVTEDIMPTLRDMIKESEKNITKNIAKGIM